MVTDAIKTPRRDGGDRGKTVHRISPSVLIVAWPGALSQSLGTFLMVVHRVSTIILTCDAAAAVEAVEQRCPSLAIVETGMGDGMGIEALQCIRAIAPHTPILALAQDRAQIEQAEALGADVVLMEGVRPDVLRATIHTLLHDTATGKDGATCLLGHRLSKLTFSKVES